MNKNHAIHLLGGTVTSAAAAIGINPQAVTQWPDELPPRIADRVVAALAKRDPRRWPHVWREIESSNLSTPAFTKEPSHA